MKENPTSAPKEIKIRTNLKSDRSQEKGNFQNAQDLKNKLEPVKRASKTLLEASSNVRNRLSFHLLIGHAVDRFYSQDLLTDLQNKGLIASSDSY